MKRAINYIKDTKGELKHVSWPTRRQTVTFTLIVLGIAVFTSLFLGFFDFILTRVLDRLII